MVSGIKEGNRLMVFESRIFGPKRDHGRVEKNYIPRSFMICQK
jgi:hypothetical protein